VSRALLHPRTGAFPGRRMNPRSLTVPVQPCLVIAITRRRGWRAERPAATLRSARLPTTVPPQMDSAPQTIITPPLIPPEYSQPPPEFSCQPVLEIVTLVRARGRRK